MKRFLLALFLLLPAIALGATCVNGVSGLVPSATLTFAAPTVNTDGTPIATPLTYNLYQSVTSGTEVKVASALAGSPINVTTGLTTNSTVYLEITVVDKNGVESARSNEVCKLFPASVPGTVTITIS